MGARELSIPGVAGRVTVSPQGLFRGVQVLVDGAPAKRKWGKVLLPGVDGSPIEARPVDQFTRTVPSLQIGGQKYEFGDAVPVLYAVVGFLPFALIVVGGALGGLCGGVGFLANQVVIRSSLAPALKLVLMLGATLVAAGCYFVLATLLYTATH